MTEATNEHVDVGTDTDPAEQLKALKAELAARKAEREAREAKQAIQQEIEATKQALLDDEAIAEAEAQHGPIGVKIAVVNTRLGCVIVKAPNHLIFRRFRDSQKMTTDAVEKLVFPSLVHPSKADVESILEEQPAVLMRLADAVCELAGARQEATAGKS